MLNANPTARRNADLMTQQLRQNGMLGQNQSVMRFSNGQVFAGPSSSQQSGNSGGSGSLPSDDDTTTTSGNSNRPREK
jgi:hypothetical protein